MSNDDLDTLRPEVRAAMDEMDRIARIVPAQCSDELRIIRAELRRLATIEADALIALDCEHDWQVEHKRAEKAEAELAESRETIKRLNRRAQVAEAGVAEKVKASGASLGRALANAAADRYMRERDEAQAELAALRSQPFRGRAQDAIDRFAGGEELSHEEMCEIVNQAVCAERELAAFKARIAEAPVGVFGLCYNGHEPGFLGFPQAIDNLPRESMLGKRVRLLVVED